MVNLQKPPRGARINWADPITRGLVGCWLFNELTGDKVFDLISKETGSLQNGAKRKYGGVLTDYLTHQFIEVDSPFRINNDTSFTIVLDVKVLNVNSNSHAIWGTKASGSSGFSFKAEQWNNTGFVGVTFFSVADYNSSISSASVIGKRNRWCLSRIGGQSVMKIAVGEQLDSISVGTMNNPNYSGFVFSSAYRSNGAHDFTSCLLYSSYLFSRTLTDDEIARLSAEPYSFLETPSSRAYFYVASGTTVEGAVTEEAGFGDAVESNILTTQEITETIGVNDTYEATITSASTGEVTETIGLNDDVSVVLEAEEFLSEGVGFSDDYQATVTGEETGTLTDVIGFNDSFEATAEMGVSITEGIGIGDNVEDSGIYNVGITEGIGLNDSVGVALDTDITKTFTGNSQTQREICLNSKIRRS